MQVVAIDMYRGLGASGRIATMYGAWATVLRWPLSGGVLTSSSELPAGSWT
jgi:hypothetical protein